jgi:ribosomal protein S18 acetylase RimI-like enzyme
MVEIRRATPADARGLAEVHIRTWRISYAGLLPEATLARLSVSARARRWAQLLHEGTEPTWAAFDGARAIGFSSSGPARDRDAPARLELYSLYVDPDKHGTGVGASLLQRSVENAAAYLWVLKGNARAIRFYEKNGFALDGVEKVQQAADGTPMNELRMSRPVQTPANATDGSARVRGNAAG